MSGPRLYRWDRTSRQRQSRTLVPGVPGPGAVVLSSDLVDLYPTPLTLTVGGTVTSVTVGGTPATNVVQAGSVVTLMTPQKAAGTYTVVVTGPGGSTNLANALEAWSPTVDFPACRLYQSDRQVTSATSTSRVQVGQRTSSMFSIMGDGMGMVRMSNGDLYTLGRWSGSAQATWPDSVGAASQITNEVRKSTNDGTTWTTILAHDGNPPVAGPTARFFPGHSTCVFTYTDAGTEYIYWIGSDANAGVARDGGVWRSVDGVTWVRIATTAPTAGKSLCMCSVLGSSIYIMGGQTDLNVKATANSNVWRSNDGGLTWTQLADGPWAARGSNGRLPVLNGKIWLIGGGAYDASGATRDYFNGVYSFDGTTWVTVLAEGHGQFGAAMYTTSEGVNGKLFTFNGYNFNTGGNISRIVGSPDGITWTTYAPPNTWFATHAQTSIVSGNRVLITNGDVTPGLFVMEEFTGPQVSSWADQGSGALALAQATALEKPLLAPAAFGPMDGVVFTGAQSLHLAARDVAVPAQFECYWVGRNEDYVTPSLGAGNIDMPNPVVDNSISNNFNGSGYDVGVVSVREGNVSWVAVTRATGLNDNQPRLVGSTLANGACNIYVGSAQQGATDTTVSFNVTNTGWECLGQGYYAANRGRFVLGAAVVLKVAGNAGFRTKLAKWARKWGSVA